MDSNLSNTIATILLRTRDEIRANMAIEGINASGRTSKALEVVQNGNKIMLIKAAGQNAPFSTLQYGRKGGDVPRGFFYIIRQWTIDKGLSFDSERGRNAFTAYVTKKIEEDGTNRYHEPNLNVYSQPIENAVNAIKKSVSDYVLGSLKAIVDSRYS